MHQRTTSTENFSQSVITQGGLRDYLKIRAELDSEIACRLSGATIARSLVSLCQQSNLSISFSHQHLLRQSPGVAVVLSQLLKDKRL